MLGLLESRERRFGKSGPKAWLSRPSRRTMAFLRDRHTRHLNMRAHQSHPQNWNGANTVLHYGKGDAPADPDEESAETSMLALHPPQSALVHVNTLLVQEVLAEPARPSRLTDKDRRGLTTSFWSTINLHGTFRLEMDTQLDLDRSATCRGRETPGPGRRSRSASDAP